MSFYQMLSDYYDILFPVNPLQVKFVRENAGKIILDMAAGTGGLAIELAKDGYEVTAIDLEHGMTNQMMVKKEREQVLLEIFNMDMRNIDHFKVNSFDTIVCLGNSLVHLDSKDEILHTLKKASRILTTKGKFIIQIVNYDRILKEQIKELPLLDRDVIRFSRTYEWREPKILFHGKLMIRVKEEEQTFKQTTELFPLTSDLLQQMLRECGFKEIELYGSYKGEPYDVNSPAIIAVAQNQK